LTVEVDEKDPRKLRENFAEWLTHKKNPRFAIAIANRIWKRFFGLGCTGAIGGFRTTSRKPLILNYFNYLVK
jgi:hypothetical protein